MPSGASSDMSSWAVPPGAAAEWLRLAAALEEAGAVPCRQSDPEAWWPDKKSVDGSAARMAVKACWRCPAREPCGAYALAAGEREGIWAGMLPDERREFRHIAA